MSRLWALCRGLDFIWRRGREDKLRVSGNGIYQIKIKARGPGWPETDLWVHYFPDGHSWRKRLGEAKWEHMQDNRRNLLINAFVWAAILFATLVLCEHLIRRRARKRAHKSAHDGPTRCG